MKDDKASAGMAGAFSALYTPFRKDGSLNEAMIEKQVEYGIRKDLCWDFRPCVGELTFWVAASRRK